MVRQELGPEAAILHCREIRRSAFGKIWHGSGVEVAAAPSLPKRKREPQPVIKQDEEQHSIKSMPTANPRLNLIVEDVIVEDVNESLREPVVKKSLQNEKLFAGLREKLLDTDLAADLVDQLIGQARVDFDGVEDLEQSIAIENLIQQLTGYISVAGRLKLSNEEPKVPKIVTLVGPTGVGKTTTIAKLAATLSIVEGHRVGLITLDGYRVGAVDQLRTYSDMLSLPLKLATTADEFVAAVHSMSDLDFILVDTDGRSPNDQAGIEQITAILSESAENLVCEINVQLVVSAGTSPRGIAQVIKAFSRSKPSALLLTKIDEVTTLGQIVKTSHDATLPISYLTDGQGVPEDLEVADADALARKILNQHQPSRPLAVKTNKSERFKETNSSKNALLADD